MAFASDPFLDGLSDRGGSADVGDLLSNPSLGLGLFAAVAKGRVEVFQDDSGSLRVSLTKRAVRAVQRTRRRHAASSAQAQIVSALESQRPLRVSGLVEVTGLDRDIILEACRALRDEGTITSQNGTESNFHVSWTLTASPDPFPAVEPKAEVPQVRKGTATARKTKVKVQPDQA